MSTGPHNSVSPDYPRLVADIGGTHARFALVTAPGAAPEQVRKLACADHPGPRDAILAYLQEIGAPIPPVGALGIANPVSGDQVKMTNHHWAFSVDALRRTLGMTRLLVVNDFTALALALPRLSAPELRRIGGGEPDPDKPIALIGPGTGLGVSGLIPCGESYIALESEGGHVTLAACDRRESDIIAHLAQHHGHVSAERVLSGPGLAGLHDAIRHLDRAPALRLTAQEVTTRALQASCPHCVEAVDIFCAMLGTVAGDAALFLGARGGVYIGGGVVPKLGALFHQSRFRARFEAKGRFAGYLAEIPVYLIEAEYPALVGAAAALDAGYRCGWEAN